MAEDEDKPLLRRLDEAATLLLDTMKIDTMLIGEDGSVKKPVEVSEQVQIFNSVVRYLAVKHKVSPEDESAGIDAFVKQLNTPTSKRPGSRGPGKDR